MGHGPGSGWSYLEAEPTTPSREVNLSPGWLQRDVERAAARIEQWNKPMNREAGLLAKLRDETYPLTTLRLVGRPFTFDDEAALTIIREYGDQRAREERERCLREVQQTLKDHLSQTPGFDGARYVAHRIINEMVRQNG